MVAEWLPHHTGGPGGGEGGGSEGGGSGDGAIMSVGWALVPDITIPSKRIQISRGRGKAYPKWVALDHLPREKSTSEVAWTVVQKDPKPELTQLAVPTGVDKNTMRRSNGLLLFIRRHSGRTARVLPGRMPPLVQLAPGRPKHSTWDRVRASHIHNFNFIRVCSLHMCCTRTTSVPQEESLKEGVGCLFNGVAYKIRVRLSPARFGRTSHQPSPIWKEV